ncbi:dethiobiotin synthase [Chitinimonas arctica]|uniref:ATP-dependent dethiobiotin synthetase BioD n=1 Tax=Chitinimonas arctica TaxID=2594795 RepID=A0A516SH41_9NEIS|nr:dethiobiotin synthase [Chitinimonas arctica]QDQ27479.1 dethiobiotin synthase [Chitinimonas arctica]
MNGYFITGTDTEVGKTVATCAMLRAAVSAGYRAVGMKPLAAGCALNPMGWLDNEDVLAHAAAGNVAVGRELVNPYAFYPPISPHLAARAAGVDIDFPLIRRCYDELAGQADLVLVEGAGGWLAPLDDSRSMADLAIDLGLPVILVVGLRLGCLNHAMLTAQAIRAAGVELAGWVANCVDPDMLSPADNLAYLKQQLPAPLLGLVPHLGGEQKAESNQEQMLDFIPKTLIK